MSKSNGSSIWITLFYILLTYICRLTWKAASVFTYCDENNWKWQVQEMYEALMFAGASFTDRDELNQLRDKGIDM